MRDEKQSTTEALTISVDRVRFTQENCSIFTAHEDGSFFPGHMAVKQFIGPVRTGQRWVICGAWKDDPKYGHQFVAQFATLATPRTFKELADFLTSGLVAGWEWSHLYALREAFGDDACTVIESESHRLQAEAGITDDQYESLMEMWARGAGLAPVYVQLTEWGIGPALAERLVKRYRFSVVETLEENPYAPIAAISYYTWRVAEGVARYLDIAPDDPRRIEAGVAEAVRRGALEDGHTWMTHEAAVSEARALLDLPAARIEEILAAVLVAIEDARENAVLVELDGHMYPGHLWWAEQYIAAAIARRMDRRPLVGAARVDTLTQPDHLSGEQFAAVQMALTNTVSVLTGGPGTGKTTALRQLVGAAAELSMPITLTAPTGKAAQRMKEATGHEAFTIHRRLKLTPGQMHVSDNAELLTGLVVVDECFAPGTLVDTPTGPRRIDTLRSGDLVLNAAGIDTITEVSCKEVRHVVRVTAGGKHITCSANHPFFTKRGWVQAQALTASDWLVERTTALQLVRQPDRSSGIARGHETFLQSVLCSEMEGASARASRENAFTTSTISHERKVKSAMGCRYSRSAGTTGSLLITEAYGRSGCESQGGQGSEGESSRSQSPPDGATAIAFAGIGGWLGSRIRRAFRIGSAWRLSNRHRARRYQGGHRSRWPVAFRPQGARKGSEEGCEAGFTRVDCIEILQQGDPRLDSIRDADGRLYFYDLGVARHPSFSVAGLLVHNCSMLDTVTASALLSGIGPDAHIPLVGDPDQLPSVGPGAVLRDLLAADVLTRVHLTRVFRNDAGVAINAAHIRAGEMIQSLPDCRLMQAAQPEQAQQMVVNLLVHELPKAGYSVDDVLVLCPKNDGPSGRHRLNTVLQAIYNGAQAGRGITQKIQSKEESIEYELRTGDKVICVKNNSELGVFNGDVGKIVRVAPPRTISAEFDGRQVTFTGADQKLLQLAYALTIHKSQGSEAPVVIAPIYFSRVLSRELLYTCLTRARKQVYLIGDAGAIQGCIHTVRISERRTGLVAALGEMVSQAAPSSKPRWLFAWSDGSAVFHTRRYKAFWFTSCGIDTRGPGWNRVPDQDVRPCARCSASHGAVLAAIPEARAVAAAG